MSEGATAPTETLEFPCFGEYFPVYCHERHLDIPLKPAHREICDKLEAAFLGQLPPEIEYIIVNVAPRIGKSTIARSLISWGEGCFPDAQWILTSYTSNLAEEGLRSVRETMSDAWFIDVFGDLIHGSKADHVTTIGGGNIFAEGVDGSLTGKGAGMKRPAGGAIVIDDPMKPGDVFSPVMAEKIRIWFETTLKNRRNSDTYTPIILIMQRLGPGDLADYIIKTYPKNTLVISFPALVDPVTGQASEADNAVSAFPETVKTETLLNYRNTKSGRYVLAAQYQHNPVAWAGNLINTGSFHRWNPSDLLKFERCVIPIDTALKTDEANDYSAASLWGLLDRRAYLIDLIHGKWESPELIAMVEAFWAKWTADAYGPFIPRPRIIIEEKAAGTPLKQHLHRKGIPAIGIERDKDKVRRLQTVLPYIETGMVLIPTIGHPLCPWLAKFETECSEMNAEGTQAHDDMVDTMIDGIEQLLGKPLSILHVLEPHGIRPGHTEYRAPKPIRA